ncbi:hypothetical protein FPZ42_04460 [Mucilaginibacter achroorhodeus]|uniref:Uncharacterized protein n=1 Tax=Mucilaginibacter achroorhodeus TaxID=2599294 RepID=A0A563UAV3_9SPHI|nr:hypothetical protein [Mucilaginibacter achroorhodeus]TWR28478.1 hypothetical protein FPZ42_04460 [Mucilaginibacter achroorhodeus]
MLDQHEQQINGIKGVRSGKEKSETRTTQPESTLKEQFNNQSAQMTGDSFNSDNANENEREH